MKFFQGRTRRILSAVLIGLMISTYASSFALADDTEGVSNKSLKQQQIEDALRSSSATSNPNTRQYEGELLTIDQANRLSMQLVTAPSAKAAARQSSDEIIANATQKMSAVESLARFLNYKTMTVDDWEAWQWSFIISQFATPLADNMNDVLNHSIFLQMAQQGLTLQRSPEAMSEGQYIDDPVFYDQPIIESTNFAEIAQTIKSNTRYLRLMMNKGNDPSDTSVQNLSNVTLRDICEASPGTVFWVVDAEYAVNGKSGALEKNQLFLDRLQVVRDPPNEASITKTQKKIPALVMTNNVKAYLQMAIGSYCKMNTVIEGALTAPTTYAELVGGEGSLGKMGGCFLFVDSWGNILVGHDAKYKMVLPNVTNPIYTNSDFVSEIPVMGYLLGNSSKADSITITEGHESIGSGSGGSGGSSDSGTSKSDEDKAWEDKQREDWKQSIKDSAGNKSSGHLIGNYAGRTLPPSIEGFVEYKAGDSEGNPGETIYTSPEGYVTRIRTLPTKVDGVHLEAKDDPTPGQDKPSLEEMFPVKPTKPSGSSGNKKPSSGNSGGTSDREETLWSSEDSDGSGGGSGGSSGSGSSGGSWDNPGSSGTASTSSVGEDYVFRYNDRNFAFNKMLTTVYSRELRASGSANPNQDESIVFIGENLTGHYQNYLSAKTGTPNSHRNSVVYFDPMSVAYPAQWGDLLSNISQNGSIMMPSFYLHKDASIGGQQLQLPYSWDPEMTLPILTSIIKGIISSMRNGSAWSSGLSSSTAIYWAEEALGMKHKDEAVISISPTKSAQVKTQVNQSGLYYLCTPDVFKLKDLWTGSNYDNSDLPIRRYFRRVMQDGINAHKTNQLADDMFDINSTDDNKNLWDWIKDLLRSLDSMSQGNRIAALMQTYNYMYGVGLNYQSTMQIPMGIISVDTADVASVKDTALTFVGKDTLDYGQYWNIFTSGENGLMVKEYRKIHTGIEKDYLREMGKNKGEVYSPSRFRDDIYAFLMRDTRVSDRWRNYGVEDVAMCAFVWLNYYIPKLQPMRSIVYGLDDEAAVTKQKEYTSAGRNSLFDSAIFKQFREQLNQAFKNDNSMGGTQTFSPQIQYGTDLVLGPYPDLVNCPEFTLYPDSIPMPLKPKYQQVVWNPVEVIMGIYRNTDWEFNQTDIPAIQYTERDVDSTTILSGIFDFIKHPVSAIIYMVAGFLQMGYNGIANSDVSNVFGIRWLKDSRIYTTIMELYFLVVGILLLISCSIMIVQYFLKRENKLGTVILRIVQLSVMAIVPQIVLASTIWSVEALSKNIMTSVNSKIAAVETEMTVRERFNNDEGYEKEYQAFKQQFDTIVDTDQGFGVQIPDYYLEGNNKIVYRHMSLSFMNEALRYNGRAQWYDYRGFVPVHKDLYKTSLFYYFYDWIKYQYLAYMASLEGGDFAGQQEFAKRMMFASGNPDEIASTSAGEASDWLSQGSYSAYVNYVDTQLMRSVGGFFTMMRDPNYVYGKSIEYKASSRWENAYIQDLYGLGYLFRNTGAEDEPFQIMQESVYWQIYSKTPALEKRYFTRFEDGQRDYKYGNDSEYIISETGSDGFMVKDPVTGVKNQYDYPRRDKPYGSLVTFYEDMKYIQGMKEPKLTELDAKLIQTNEKIYKKVRESVYYNTDTIHDEAFIVNAALIATFEVNKMLGKPDFFTPAVEPTGFDQDSISIDKVIRVMFASDMDDIYNERQVMYMISEDGWGIITAIIVTIAMVLLFVAMFIRSLLILVMFVLSMVLCLFFYVLLRDHKRRLCFGVVSQCIGIVGMHIITLLALNGIVTMSFGSNNGFQRFASSVLFLLVTILAITLHFFLAKCMFKNITSLGGDMIHHYSEKVLANIQGKTQSKDSQATINNMNSNINNRQDQNGTEDLIDPEDAKLEEQIAERNRRASEMDDSLSSSYDQVEEQPAGQQGDTGTLDQQEALVGMLSGAINGIGNSIGVSGQAIAKAIENDKTGLSGSAGSKSIEKIAGAVASKSGNEMVKSVAGAVSNGMHTINSASKEAVNQVAHPEDKHSSGAQGQSVSDRSNKIAIQSGQSNQISQANPSMQSSQSNQISQSNPSIQSSQSNQYSQSSQSSHAGNVGSIGGPIATYIEPKTENGAKVVTGGNVTSRTESIGGSSTVNHIQNGMGGSKDKRSIAVGPTINEIHLGTSGPSIHNQINTVMPIQQNSQVVHSGGGQVLRQGMQNQSFMQGPQGQISTQQGNQKDSQVPANNGRPALSSTGVSGAPNIRAGAPTINAGGVIEVNQGNQSSQVSMGSASGYTEFRQDTSVTGYNTSSRIHSVENHWERNQTGSAYKEVDGTPKESAKDSGGSRSSKLHEIELPSFDDE